MFQEYPEIMNINDLMKALKIGRNTAYNLLSSGEIKAMKINNSWSIPRINVENYIRESCGLPRRDI